MANWLKDIYREIRPNALWDVIKFMIIAGVSLLIVLLYRLWVYLRQLPQDRVVDLAIFGGAFVLLTSAYALTKYRSRKAPPSAPSGHNPSVVDAKREETQKAAPKQKEAVSNQNREIIPLPPDQLVQIFEPWWASVKRQKQIHEDWQKWTGRWVMVAGVLGSAHKQSDGSLMVVFSVAHKEYPEFIAMYFRKEWADRLSGLRGKERVKVVGKVQKLQPHELFLEDCELLDFQPS
ncbi:MAG TPA: hypothetical protein VF658_15020 [Pyrinomonadaceae bacterium]|jgi:hypothetical protein